MKYEEWKKERTRIWIEMEVELDTIQKRIPVWWKRAWGISRDLGVSVRKFQVVGDLSVRMDLALNDVEKLDKMMKEVMAKQVSLELERMELYKVVKQAKWRVDPVQWKEMAGLSMREHDVLGGIVVKVNELRGYLEGLKDMVKAWIAEEKVEDEVLKGLS